MNLTTWSQANISAKVLAILLLATAQIPHAQETKKLPPEVATHYTGLEGDFYDLLKNSDDIDVSAQAFKLHKEAFSLAKDFNQQASDVLQVLSQDELAKLAEFLATPAGQQYAHINKRVLSLALQTGSKQVNSEGADPVSAEFKKIARARKDGARFFINGGTNFYYLNSPNKKSAMSTSKMTLKFPEGKLSTHNDRVKVVVLSPVTDRTTGKLKMTQEITTYIIASEIRWHTQ